MNIFRADLHIHTLLSPCGHLDMSPENIVLQAKMKELDIIGITDHNSTRHCDLVSSIAAARGIFVMKGAEVTTKEEVHCLVFFENQGTLEIFQDYLDSNLPNIQNDPALFGDQVQVDEEENIIYEEKKLLISALNVSMDHLAEFVRGHSGLFIPAHIDRNKNSIYSQLGFLPEGLKADALEISGKTNRNNFSMTHPEISAYQIISSSDAHVPDQIGSVFTEFYLDNPSFSEIRMAFNGNNMRKLIW